MRTIEPIKHMPETGGEEPGPDWATWLHLVLPFRLFNERLRVDVTVSGHANGRQGPTARQLRLARAALYGILGLLLFLGLSGGAFLFYMVKSALGIDLFKNFHLF